MIILLIRRNHFSYEKEKNREMESYLNITEERDCGSKRVGLC